MKRGNYPVYDFKKAMFLIATGNRPVQTGLNDGRTEFIFDDGSRPYTRLWHHLHDAALDAAKSGFPLSPDELYELQGRLWAELDEKYPQEVQS